MNPATGPKSTSFKLSAAGIVTGIGTLITGLVQNPNALSSGAGAVTDVRTAIGAAVVAISVAAKLFHDNGFNKASIAAAGSEVADALPGIKTDLDKAAGLVESDFPALKGVVNTLEAHVTALETKAAATVGVTPEQVEDAVRKILATVVPIPVTPTITATPPVA
jgi:hypothetical protein